MNSCGSSYRLSGVEVDAAELLYICCSVAEDAKFSVISAFFSSSWAHSCVHIMGLCKSGLILVRKLGHFVIISIISQQLRIVRGLAD